MNSTYQTSQKIIHWVMALLIMLDLFVAQKFGGEMTLADRLESRSDHATLGTIVIILFLLRIILRLRHGGVAANTSSPAWQNKAASLAHLGLYILMATLMITGVLSAMSATSNISVFGLEINQGNTDNADFLSIRFYHELATQLIIGLISIHILAALYHHFIQKDGVLLKMLGKNS